MNNMEREFDLERVAGRKMPYKAPSEDFFEQVSANVMARIGAERLFLTKRIVASFMAVAASVALFCGVYVSEIYYGSDDMSEYINEMSDEELLTLFYDMEVDDTFYSAL